MPNLDKVRLLFGKESGETERFRETLGRRHVVGDAERGARLFRQQLDHGPELEWLGSQLRLEVECLFAGFKGEEPFYRPPVHGPEQGFKGFCRPF